VPGRPSRKRPPLTERPAWLRLIAGLLSLLLASSSAARTLEVGPERALRAPSDAARIARDGDTILIDAGTYAGDVAEWRASGLVIRAAGGPVVLRADGASIDGRGIWFTRGRDTTVEGITFVGATGPYGNGSGIRHHGVGLTVRYCRFLDNEMGLLTWNRPGDEVLVEFSVFARSGPGPRHNHNVYIGNAASFTMRGSYVHHAKVGHNVKSRAKVTRLLYNRIMDEGDGHSSYAVDLPNGGDALLLGNLVQQGPRTENVTLVSYGAEGIAHPVNRLRLVHNTLVNDHARRTFVRVHGLPSRVLLVNNLLAGPGIVYQGVPATLRNNAHLPAAPLADAAGFDYRPRYDLRIVDQALPPGTGTDLIAATLEYRHPAGTVPRRGRRPDIGALQWDDSARPP